MEKQTTIKISREELKDIIERKYNVKIMEFTLSSAGFKGVTQ